MTRADSIRAMSDEELAMRFVISDEFCNCKRLAECIEDFEGKSDEECYAMCAKCALAWLKEEVPEDVVMA